MKQVSIPGLILHSGHITTLNSKHPAATRIAVKAGRIVRVDDADSHEPNPNTIVIDLHGRRVIPGLNDSHQHAIRGGFNYNLELHWDGCACARRLLANAQERSAAHAAGAAGNRHAGFFGLGCDCFAF